MLPIIASAPTRVDLAGGTLDLWPLHHLLNHKTTVNFAIDLKATAEVRLAEDGLFHLISVDGESEVQGSFAEVGDSRSLPLLAVLLRAIWKKGLPPIVVKTSALSPKGAGLGGSSSVAVVIASALLRARRHFEDMPEMAPSHLVRLVQDAEASILHGPTGCQDYWGAICGGINVITYPFGKNKVDNLGPETLPQLDASMSLCYSGRSRLSGINNWEIYKRVIERDDGLLAAFNEIGLLAEQCGQAVVKGKFDLVLECSQKEWMIRKQLWPDIETEETQQLDAVAVKAGAYFTRVCGAGGGGVMVAFSPPGKKLAVEAALEQAGGSVLPGKVCAEGLQVE